MAYYNYTKDLSFQQDVMNINGKLLNTLSKETITKTDFRALKTAIGQTLQQLNQARKPLAVYNQAQETMKKYRRAMGVKLNVDAVKGFLAWHELHKRSPKTKEEIDKAYEVVTEAHYKTLLIGPLKKSLMLITTIRNFYKNPIAYATTIRSVNGQGDTELWMSVSTNLEEILSQVSINSQGGLAIEHTVGELTEILEQEQRETVKKYKNLLVDNQTRQLWNTLERIKQKIGKSYNYGQLLESFVYLLNQGIEEPTTADVYKALIEGRNRVPMEYQGDFILDGQDIQSKLFSAVGSDSSQRSVTILSLSNATRILSNMYKAIDLRKSVERMNADLERVFTLNGEQVSRYEGSFKNEQQIKNIINDVLNTSIMPNLTK